MIICTIYALFPLQSITSIFKLATSNRFKLFELTEKPKGSFFNWRTALQLDALMLSMLKNFEFNITHALYHFICCEEMFYEFSISILL